MLQQRHLARGLLKVHLGPDPDGAYLAQEQHQKMQVIPCRLAHQFPSPDSGGLQD